MQCLKQQPRKSIAVISAAKARTHLVATKSMTRVATNTEAGAFSLALDIGRLMGSARRQVAETTNAALTTLYWQVGTRIRHKVLKKQRAEYGAEIVSALGRQWSRTLSELPPREVMRERFHKALAAARAQIEQHR
jgi:fructose-1,6-bisphosphatase/sedoheptulose 1,7-bisphosphatase-like protein